MPAARGRGFRSSNMGNCRSSQRGYQKKELRIRRQVQIEIHKAVDQKS
jgi:hypothetical protein